MFLRVGQLIGYNITFITFDTNIKMAVILGGGGGMAKSKIMAKVKYDFSTNKGRNECRPNTSFSSNFDWKIHFLYYFQDSMSNGQSKSQIIENNMIFTK